MYLSRLPSQPASNVCGRFSDSFNWLDSTYLAMTSNNLCIISISLVWIAVQVCYFFWYVQSIWIVILDHILLSLLILVKMYRTSSVISCCLFWLLLSLFGLKHHTYSMSTGGVYDINGKDSIRLCKSLNEITLDFLDINTIIPLEYVDSCSKI